MNSWHPFQRRTIPLNLLETIQMQIQIQMKSSTLSSQRRLSPAGNLCVLGPLSRDRWWVTLPKICLGRVQNMMVVIMINAISVMILRAQFIQYTNTYMTKSKIWQSLRCNGGPMGRQYFAGKLHLIFYNIWDHVLCPRSCVASRRVITWVTTAEIFSGRAPKKANTDQRGKRRRSLNNFLIEIYPVRWPVIHREQKILFWTWCLTFWFLGV